MRELLQTEVQDLLEVVERLRERIIAGKVNSAFVSWFEEVHYCQAGCKEHVSGLMRCRADLRTPMISHLLHETIVLANVDTNAPASTMPPAGHA